MFKSASIKKHTTLIKKTVSTERMTFLNEDLIVTLVIAI